MADYYYTIEICNVGRGPELIKVFDRGTKVRRLATFETQRDAEECVLVIDRMRSDTAYQGCIVRKEPI